ncbi:hypothetical protein CHARACLAT_018208, partial [Characodon lateralis]|nr:hypothetical protein [Characodon lateralis]
KETLAPVPLRPVSQRSPGRSDHWKGGCFYTASGIMGRPLLPPIPKLFQKFPVH